MVHPSILAHNQENNYTANIMRFLFGNLHVPEDKYMRNVCTSMEMKYASSPLLFLSGCMCV